MSKIRNQNDIRASFFAVDVWQEGSALDDCCAAAITSDSAAEASPARPEHARKNESHGTDHDQNDPHGVNAETGRGRGYSSDHQRTSGDHHKTDCCTHQGAPLEWQFCTRRPSILRSTRRRLKLPTGSNRRG
jgi:hypothetical protein